MVTMEMTPDVGEAGRPFGAGSSGPRLKVVQRDEETKKMTEQELAEMPLESLLYYVLMGEGRRSL
jgi:hypothetical protein